MRAAELGGDAQIDLGAATMQNNSLNTSEIVAKLMMDVEYTD